MSLNAKKLGSNLLLETNIMQTSKKKTILPEEKQICHNLDVIIARRFAGNVTLDVLAERQTVCFERGMVSRTEVSTCCMVT